jgi:hypothetical protein
VQEVIMRFLVSTLLSLSLLIPLADAKEKKKIILPDDVLRAKTVLVVVSPQAQTSLLNPNENRTAQEDVEKALMSWGRFNPVLESQEPDLIIAIRKGSENRALSPSISGGPTDNRPVILEPTDGAVRLGVQQGRPSNPIDPASEPQNTGPGLSKQVGASEDTFEVYRGRIGTGDPLDSAPVWRYMAKDALRSPAVPAVDQFRKVVEQADKEAQKQSKSKPQSP